MECHFLDFLDVVRFLDIVRDKSKEVCHIPLGPVWRKGLAVKDIVSSTSRPLVRRFHPNDTVPSPGSGVKTPQWSCRL
jgi:hypothetical protein